MANARKSLLRNLLLTVCLVFAATIGFLYFALKDTSEVNYPTSLAEIYTPPEVDPETAEAFRALFFRGDSPLGSVVEATADALPANLSIPIDSASTSAGDDPPRDPDAFWQSVEDAWQTFQPARETYLGVVRNPPYPLAYESFEDQAPALHRLRAAYATSLLKARALQMEGKHPIPLLTESIRFIRNYYQSSAATLDLIQALAAYRLLVDSFDSRYLASTPEVVTALREWKDTWRRKNARAMQLEFIFLYNAIMMKETAPAHALFGDAGGAPGPFFMNFLFKPNQTFNAHWDYNHRLAQAVLQDDLEAMAQIEQELVDNAAGGGWTNLLGNTIVSISILGIEELYNTQLQFEQEIAPILNP